MQRVRAVLFDIDGTLLDTRDAWVAAFDGGLEAIHKHPIAGSVAAEWIGTPIEMIYAQRCGLAGDELVSAVRAFQRIEAESAMAECARILGFPKRSHHWGTGASRR